MGFLGLKIHEDIFELSKKIASRTLAFKRFHKKYPGSSPMISFVEEGIAESEKLEALLKEIGINGLTLEALIQGAISAEADNSLDKRPTKEGRCCSCGYEGEEETPCKEREDGTHCNHWWDRPCGD